MARVITYITILATILFGMAMFNIGNTYTGQIFQLMNQNATVPTNSSELTNPSDWASSGTLFNYLFGSGVGLIAVLTAGLAIVASLFRGSSPESYILAPVAAYIGTWFIADAALVLTNMRTELIGAPGFIYPVMLMLFFVWVLGFIIALIQWWRGNDII